MTREYSYSLILGLTDLVVVCNHMRTLYNSKPFQRISFQSIKLSDSRLFFDSNAVESLVGSRGILLITLTSLVSWSSTKGG